MKRIVFAFLIMGSCVSGFSQLNDSIREQANFYYENDEYEMALVNYNSILDKESTDYELYKKRGNCYYNLGNNEAAINDYKQALIIKPNYADVLFNLGNIYDNMGIIDSALYFFRQYSYIRPHEAISYIRLSLIKLNEIAENDSSLFYAQRAIETEPENFLSYYALSMAYLYLEKYDESIDAANKGLKYNEEDNLILYHPLGISYYFMGNYEKAYHTFSKADSLEDNTLEFIDYRVQSLLMLNTSAEKYKLKPSGKIIFNDLLAKNMPILDEWSTDKNHNYNYGKLLSKFHSNILEMGIDEFFMLYFGFSHDIAYSPYGNNTSEIMDLWNNNDYDKFVTEAEAFLAKDPTHFGLYWNLSSIYAMNGNKEKQFENLFKYYGFLEGIVASGNGKNVDSAYIVIKISDEYEILNNFGYLFKSQSLITEKQNSYDLMVCEDSFGEDTKVYFNIDKAFSTLDATFKSKKSKKIRGRKLKSQ